jgi:hypothetical protein
MFNQVYIAIDFLPDNQHKPISSLLKKTSMIHPHSDLPDPMLNVHLRCFRPTPQDRRPAQFEVLVSLTFVHTHRLSWRIPRATSSQRLWVNTHFKFFPIYYLSTTGRFQKNYLPLNVLEVTSGTHLESISASKLPHTSRNILNLVS